jgi:hypothetical protein
MDANRRRIIPIVEGEVPFSALGKRIVCHLEIALCMNLYTSFFRTHFVCGKLQFDVRRKQKDPSVKKAG